MLISSHAPVYFLLILVHRYINWFMHLAWWTMVSLLRLYIIVKGLEWHFLPRITMLILSSSIRLSRWVSGTPIRIVFISQNYNSSCTCNMSWTFTLQGISCTIHKAVVYIVGVCLLIKSRLCPSHFLFWLWSVYRVSLCFVLWKELGETFFF